MSSWTLEYHSPKQGLAQQILLTHFPFTIGRSHECDLTIDSRDVSRLHAELHQRENHLLLKDLASTNGTHINHQRQQGTNPVVHGDVLHFANAEYRLIQEDQTVESFESDETHFGLDTLTHIIPQGLRQFQELLEGRQTTTALEPIVNSADYSRYGYEVLGRGRHPGLPDRPLALFDIAESANKAVELSELFRLRGIEIALEENISQPLFVNTHPKEMEQPDRLLATLDLIRNRYPNSPFVLEIHEESVTNLASLKALKARLQAIQIELAYDDFGSGQARLLELVEAPPHYIKFDISLIRDIEIASPMRIRMIKALLNICTENGIITLAEGVSSEEKAKICQALGFEMMQGYFFPKID